MGEPDNRHGQEFDRRAAIKRAAVAAAAGLVWSAPRVEGLTLRPDYAAAQTGLNQMTLTFNALTVNAPTIDCGTVTSVTRAAGFISMQADGTYTMNAATFDPPQDVFASRLNNGTGDFFFLGIVGAGTLTVSYNCV